LKQKHHLLWLFAAGVFLYLMLFTASIAIGWVALTIAFLFISIFAYRSHIKNKLFNTVSSSTETLDSDSLQSNDWLEQPIVALQQQLKRSQTQQNNFNDLFNAIGDAVIQTDEAGLICYVNPATTKLLKTTEQELVGSLFHIGSLTRKSDESSRFDAILKRLAKPAMTSHQARAQIKVDIKGRMLTLEQRVTGIYSPTYQFNGAVIVLRDVTKEARLRERLKYQANHDSVTKLFNRFKFEQRLIDAWNDARLSDTTHALLQIDLDRFKLVNDNAGHGAGDQLLRDIGQLIKGLVRETDICARIGGDEFAILLYDVNDLIAKGIMAKINAAFANFHFNYAGQVFDVGASVGGTLLTKHSPEVDEVKRQADTACYIAKNRGLNNHKLFQNDEQVFVNLQQEPKWASRINKALEQDDFELFFQPIVPISNKNDKRHIEILLRLKTEHDYLNPGVFLPAVERFRLTDKVDMWVVEKTFTWLNKQPMLWNNHVVAINLSGESIANEVLIEQILTKHKRFGFPASAVCFEITETSAITNMQQASAMVDKLSKTGFAIALDDFGKGFSTFSYLKNLPAQYIKIDGSYVEDILSNDNDYSIVCAIVALAKSMNMKTIAEFVQCDETVEVLQNIGIDYAQGFGIREPLPLSHFFEHADKKIVYLNERARQSNQTHG